MMVRMLRVKAVRPPIEGRIAAWGRWGRWPRGKISCWGSESLREGRWWRCSKGWRS